MSSAQLWLVETLNGVEPVASFMRSAWGWPAIESLHFIGLALLIGTIGVFDLRLLGVARRIPLVALHRLVPWGLVGYGINVTTGAMFIMTEPNQYILNPSFHLKLLFMAVAGFNALAFYAVVYPRATAPDASDEAPPRGRLVAVVSLCMWMGVIVCGRMITFYRPGPCGPEGPGFLADCIPIP
jgi:cytochrome bd-type quinol oxidase subunit 1